MGQVQLRDPEIWLEARPAQLRREVADLESQLNPVQCGPEGPL